MLLGRWLAADVVGASQFAVTPSGDWLATVAGVYNYCRRCCSPSSPTPGEWVFIGRLVGGHPLGDPDDVRPMFNGRGTLSAVLAKVPERDVLFTSDGTLSAVVVGPVAVAANFSGDGELTSGDRTFAWPDFTGTGQLSCVRVRRDPAQEPSVLQGRGIPVRAVSGLPVSLPFFTGEGMLSASVVEARTEPSFPRPRAMAHFSRPRPPCRSSRRSPAYPGRHPDVDFKFNELSGPIAESDPRGYTLYAQDPATAWYGTGNDLIDGHFVGVTGSRSAGLMGGGHRDDATTPTTAARTARRRRGRHRRRVDGRARAGRGGLPGPVRPADRPVGVRHRALRAAGAGVVYVTIISDPSRTRPG